MAALTYGPEKISRGLLYRCISGGAYSLRFDLQHINNPGYNKDRGPVLVPAVRLHLDF